MDVKPVNYQKNPPPWRLGDQVLFTSQLKEGFSETERKIFEGFNPEDRDTDEFGEALNRLKKICLIGTLERRHDDYLVVGEVINAGTGKRIPHLDHERIEMSRILCGLHFRENKS